MPTRYFKLSLLSLPLNMLDESNFYFKLYFNVIGHVNAILNTIKKTFINSNFEIRLYNIFFKLLLQIIYFKSKFLLFNLKIRRIF